jgi:hypothetical protein
MDFHKFSNNLLEKMDLTTNIDKTVMRAKSRGGGTSPAFECSFSADNTLMAQDSFSEGVMQLFEGYKPAWFQTNWFLTLYKSLQIETEFHQKLHANKLSSSYNRIYFERPNAKGRIVLDIAKND